MTDEFRPHGDPPGDGVECGRRPDGSPSHYALLYETRGEQLATVSRFLREGIDRGERCVYVRHDRSREELLTALRAAGIDVDAALDRKSVV